MNKKIMWNNNITNKMPLKKMNIKMMVNNKHK